MSFIFRTWIVCAALLATQTGRTQTWSGVGGNDAWSTGANWEGNTAPANPATTPVVFDETDSGGTSVLDANWTIGGLKSLQTVVNGVTTQTLNLGGYTLTVTGNVNIADKETSADPYSSELSVQNGTLQLGSPTARVNVYICDIKKNNYYGALRIGSGATLVPYIEQLLIGFANNSQSGGGTLDLRGATVQGGVLEVKELAIARNSRTPYSALILDNDTNGLNTLVVTDIFHMSTTWGKARLGHPTGGAYNEHVLPPGFNLVIGSATTPASSMQVGYKQYQADGRLIAGAGGTFTAYVDDMRLADVMGNTQTSYTYGIVDLATMTSCTVSANTLVVAKDYPDVVTGAVSPKAVGILSLPAGTLTANAVEIGGHHTSSQGLVQLNGTVGTVADSLTITKTGTLKVYVEVDGSSNNFLDLTDAAVSIEPSGKIELNFTDPAPGTALFYGLAWLGDHVAELQTMQADGRLVINDAAIAPATVSIFVQNGVTFVGIPSVIGPPVVWSGLGGDDLWSTGANWVGGVAPGNPSGDLVAFDHQDNGGISMLSSDWTVGGLRALQTTVDGLVTQTLNLGTHHLTVLGNVTIADRDGADPYSQELTVSNGTLQLGSPSLPVDLMIGDIDKNNYYGALKFGAGTVLIPYLDDVSIGLSNNSASGGGTLDLRGVTVPGGVLETNTLSMATKSRQPTSYLIFDQENPNGVNTLIVHDSMVLSDNWGKARIGYPSGGTGDEHLLPAGFSIHVGSPGDRATKLSLGTHQYGADARLIATSGGSFSAYVDDLRLADVVGTTQNRTMYGILDLRAMDSATVDATTLVVCKDYTSATGTPKGIARLQMPTGTLVAANVEVGGTRPGSEGLVELNGSYGTITGSLSIPTTGILRVNISSGATGTNYLDLTNSTVNIDPVNGGRIELNFLGQPTDLLENHGLVWNGDHVAELQALQAAGRLVIDTTAIAPLSASIYMNAGKTYIGPQRPTQAWQVADLAHYPSFGKIMANMRETLVTSTTGQPGFTGRIFGSSDFSGAVLYTAEFTDRIAVDWHATEAEEDEDEEEGEAEVWDWNGPSEADYVPEISVVWEGMFGPVPEGGTWMFHVDGDKQTLIYLDDQLVMDNLAEGTNVKAEVQLEQGRSYRMRITHTNANSADKKKVDLQFRYWLKAARTEPVASNITIVNSANQTVFTDSFTWNAPATVVPLEVGLLPNDPLYYTATVTSDVYPTPDVKTIYRQASEFEGTSYGIDTQNIYAPFQALDLTGSVVSPVMRRYTQTGLGLWSSVEAIGNAASSTYQELLASPIVLVVNGSPVTGSGSFTLDSDQSVVYTGSSSGAPIAVSTVCDTGIDGAMKVAMTLGAGAVSDMYLEIPLKAEMVPLYHVVKPSTGIRNNPAGARPDVWDSTITANNFDHAGNFKAYIWLGAEERGLSWFADNEKGWELDWGNSDQWPDWLANGIGLFGLRRVDDFGNIGEDAVPCQSFFLDGNVVRLRIHFIQKPVVITQPRTITFGLMATPGKPMPANWRMMGRRDFTDNYFYMGNLLGLESTFHAKAPRNNDWSAFDTFLAVRLYGKNAVDIYEEDGPNAFFPTWIANNVTGTSISQELVDQLVGLMDIAFTNANNKLKNKTPPAGLTMYFEETNLTDPWHDEMKTWENEWASNNQFRNWDTMPDGAITIGHKTWGTGTTVFGDSYQDYVTWAGHNWLQRGIGLYFDNTFFQACRNPVVSNAYVRPDGGIQPSAQVWNRRDFFRRIWTMHQQRKQSTDPIVALTPAYMMQHMTNSHIAPIHVWNEYNLDLEWKRYELKQFQQKFTPELLRAQTIGLQTGSIPVALTGNGVTPNPELYKRTHTGGMYVHEIRGPGLNTSSWYMFQEMEDFGYGLADCEVFNYWEEVPKLTASDSNCKWLLLKRNGELFVLLCTWTKDPATVNFTVDFNALGVAPPAGGWVDAENTAVTFTVNGNGSYDIPMDGWGVRMIRFPTPQP